MPVRRSNIAIDGQPAEYVQCDVCGAELDVHVPFTKRAQLRNAAAARGWDITDTPTGLRLRCAMCCPTPIRNSQQPRLPLEGCGNDS